MKRILLSILFTIIAIMVIAMLLLKWIVGTNSIVRKSDEQILKSTASSGKEALVIYQPSRSSLTKDITYSIAEELKSEGYDVTINYPSKTMNYDISKFNVIILGTPIYAGTSSSVLENFIRGLPDLSGKRVMIFGTGGDKNIEASLNDLAKLLKAPDKAEVKKFIKGDNEKAVLAVKAFTEGSK